MNESTTVTLEHSVTSQSIGFVIIYVIFIVCALVVIIFSAHLFYFTCRGLVQELTASDRYLLCLTAVHIVQVLAVITDSLLSGARMRYDIKLCILMNIVNGGLDLSSQGTILALLVDRYLYIKRGMLYDSERNIRASGFVMAAVFSSSTVVSILVTLPELKSQRYLYVACWCSMVLLSLVILGFNIYKNVKVYQITSYSLTEQQSIDFVRHRTARILVILLDILITMVQIINTVMAVLLVVDDHLMGEKKFLNRSCAKKISSFFIGIYVVWYIVTDKKWRLLYKNRGLFSTCSRSVPADQCRNLVHI